MKFLAILRGLGERPDGFPVGSIFTFLPASLAIASQVGWLDLFAFSVSRKIEAYDRGRLVGGSGLFIGI